MAVKNTFNIALVGCGGMAARYRHRYTEIPGVRLAAVMDVNEETAKEAAEELGTDNWSTNFEDILTEGIDMVDISTPNFLHAPQAVRAMEKGKHIILQKPIATSIEEGEKIVKTARVTKVKAGMYMSMLEIPLYHDIKEIIKRGKLGNIASVYCRGAGSSGPQKPPNTWRASLVKTGGGALIQKTIHFIDLAQWLLNKKILRVAGFSKNMMCKNIGGDDITNAACEFENGIQGTLEGSYISSPHILAVYGTRGYVIIIDGEKLDIMLDEGFLGDVINYEQPGKLKTFYYSQNLKSMFKQRNPYDQHIAFVKAVMEGGKVPVPLEKGLYDLKIVKAVYRSSKEQRVVEVE